MTIVILQSKEASENNSAQGGVERTSSHINNLYTNFAIQHGRLDVLELTLYDEHRLLIDVWLEIFVLFFIQKTRLRRIHVRNRSHN